MGLNVGARLGHYDVTALIGSGHGRSVAGARQLGAQALYDEKRVRNSAWQKKI